LDNNKVKADILTEQINLFEKQTRIINKSIMAETFGRTASSYYQSLYAYERISALNEDEITNNLIVKIIEIEQLFSSAQEAYVSSNIFTKLEYANYGINKCEEFIKILDYEKYNEKSEALSCLYGYYYLRLGDFNFHKGYRQEHGENTLLIAIKHYKKAIEIYFRINIIDKISLKLLAKNLEGRDKDSQISFDLEENQTELFCLVYLLNVIGECYNVMVQKEMKGSITEDTEIYKESAVMYCGLAYEIIKKFTDDVNRPPHFAVYIRNYGTTLERHQDESGNQPNDIYLAALKWNKKDFLSYQTYCSYMLGRYLRESLLVNIPFGEEYSGLIEIDESNESTIRAIHEDILPKISILQKGLPNSKRAYDIETTARSILKAVNGISEFEKQLHSDFIDRAKGISKML